MGSWTYDVYSVEDVNLAAGGCYTYLQLGYVVVKQEGGKEVAPV